MFSRIQSYLKYIFKSKNHHGVHSPFVFDLLTKCIYSSLPKSEFRVLSEYRRDLSTNKQFIEVSDFGAGSQVFSSNRRKISSIAKHVGITKKRAELLYKLIKYFQPETILEVGTSLGIATCAMASAKTHSQLVTLEGCPQTAKVAQKMLDKYELEDIEIIEGNFKDTFFEVIDNNKFDLIYFDGNHTKEATLAYFEASIPNTHNDSVLIFDDIYWSKEMEDAWNEIKNHPEVTVTIDTYQWGIVFLRKEQQKEHFTLRV